MCFTHTPNLSGYCFLSTLIYDVDLLDGTDVVLPLPVAR